MAIQSKESCMCVCVCVWGVCVWGMCVYVCVCVCVWGVCVCAAVSGRRPGYSSKVFLFKKTKQPQVA